MSKKFGKKFLEIKNLKVKNKKEKIFERGRYWGLYIVIGGGVVFLWGRSGRPGDLNQHTTPQNIFYIYKMQ